MSKPDSVARAALPVNTSVTVSAPSVSERTEHATSPDALDAAEDDSGLPDLNLLASLGSYDNVPEIETMLTGLMGSTAVLARSFEASAKASAVHVGELTEFMVRFCSRATSIIRSHHFYVSTPNQLLFWSNFLPFAWSNCICALFFVSRSLRSSKSSPRTLRLRATHARRQRRRARSLYLSALSLSGNSRVSTGSRRKLRTLRYVPHAKLPSWAFAG
jgi:hypothetical protein